MNTPPEDNYSISSLLSSNSATMLPPHTSGRTLSKRSKANNTSNLKSIGNTKKKLTIRPLKKIPSIPKSFEEESWQKLHAAIVAVQKKEAISFSREELYRLVEDVCTWKLAANLYTKLQSCCACFIAESVRNLGRFIHCSLPNSSISTYIAKNSSLRQGASAFLERVAVLWEDHCNNMLAIRMIFLYLDRTYVMQTPHILSIWEMGLMLLRVEFQNCPQVEQHLIACLLILIEKERNGESIHHHFLRTLIKMLSSLQLYHNKFEIPFITASEQYYTTEGNQLVEQVSVSQFLIHVEKRLEEEQDRVIQYLDSTSTKKSLIHVVEVKLLKPHVDTLLEKGFENLVKEKRVEDLKRAYMLFSRIDAIQILKVAFGECLRKHVTSLVTATGNASLVEKLLQTKKDADTVLKNAFSGQQEFSFVLKKSMETAINIQSSRPAELIAKYVDAKLRTGNKGGSETQIEALLDDVIVLFRYIQSKDVFEAFYKKDLAKRLLLGKSASFDLEKLMLSKLRTECGSSFTNKLEGMFKDIDLSQNVATQFQNHSASRAALDKMNDPVDLHVQVLTTGFWPPYAAVEINLPSVLVPLKEIFEKFYACKYQGRQLQWQHSLGHCLVKAKFKKGRKELAVSLFQASVLLCFNAKPTLGFREIKEQTSIEDGELQRTLQSLACGKVRVILKEPKGKEVHPDDVFHFNDSFTNQLFRIKINAIQMKETKQENEKTHERVFRDRQYQVDAAIVRIMKARKKLSHALLMTEIFAQIKFPAKPADIKRRIESLIDREYLERDFENAQMYNYLA
uniref:PREDICTED: similar to Cullin4B (CUL4B) isoform 3 pu n=1 Tax=Albugo laibachii Nc14 TaxID=890382 RepID=F0WSX7_9STRA|nr:PREDICTED: similar to Cullin4B (CUL4B) isoform 3 pu [Albugo laibachii Nc14]|eukprot:CCA24461.1 PREDICTED: similar to Cullin4B (CUL4B) isoform 3 pu [Albugo laibachii Nc14]